MEVPTPEVPTALGARGCKLNGTGVADAVVGPIGLQLPHGVAIEDALPLACVCMHMCICARACAWCMCMAAALARRRH